MSDHSWAPARGLVALAWVLFAGAAAWFVLLLAGGGDPAGRLIAGVAAAALGFMALHGTIVRPRLAVHGHGLEIRGLTGVRAVDWTAVQRVRVYRTRRFGRESSQLEIDMLVGGDERLAVFGRLDLNADPEDVALVLLPHVPTRSA
jgi:hypothetical protein